MSRNRGKDTDIRRALRALLSDIEGMFEGAEIFPESGQPEEFFGPFSVGKLRGVEIEDVSVSWPNLAISMRNARNAMRNADAEDASTPRL